MQGPEFFALALLCASSVEALETLTLRLKIAQKPSIVWSLGPKALKI